MMKIKIEKYLRLAKSDLTEGKLSQAIATCEKILEIQPNSAAAYRILGETYQVENDFEKAMYAYAKAVEIQPEYAEVHAFLGQLYSQKKWLGEAANQYQKAIDLGLKWPEVYYNLGNIFYKVGYSESAIQSYETAIILKPDYIKAYFGLGIIFERERNYQGAVDIYRKVIKLNPDFVEAYNSLGSVLADWNRTSEAIEVYQQALVLKPDSASLYNNLGFSLLEKNPIEAIAAYHRAIELDPNFIKAHYNLGKALQIIGEHERAVKYFQEVIRLKGEKDNVLVYSDCVFSLMTIGKFPTAFVYLKNIITNHQFVDGYCQILESKLGNVEQTVSDEMYLTKVAVFNFMKQLRKLDSNSENYQQKFHQISQYLLQYYIHFGNVLMENQSYEAAGNFYQRALQIQPNSADVYSLLGNSLVKQKRLNSAIISYQIALKILLSENRIDERTKIYFQLGKVMEKQQKWQSAIDYYTKVSWTKLQLSTDIFNHDLLPYQKLEGLYLSTKDWIQKLDGKNYQKQYKEVKLEELTTEYREESIKSPIKVNFENRKKDLKCLGLNCHECLNQIYQWFNPKSPTQGVYSLSVQGEFKPNIDSLSQEISLLNSVQNGGRKSSTPLKKERTSLSSLTSPSKEGTISTLTKDTTNDMEGIYYFQKLSRGLTFVTIVPEGRAWIMPKKNYWRLCYGIAIMTPDNYLLADLSREYPSPLPGCTKHDPSQHQIFDFEELPPLKKINGRVAVLSVLSGNIYFHWMVDLLPRIEILRQGIDLEKIDWFVVNNYQQPFQRETLKSLGIKEEKILASDRHPHIQAEELVVPSYPSYLGWLQPWGLKFLREVFLRGITNNKSDFPERIYIGRGNARYRRVMNEPEVVEILGKFGFTYVTPESMSLETQISTFAHAKIIVAPHGSGLTNLVFCNPGTKVIEFFSPHYLRYYYWHISQLLGLEHYYLIGEIFSCYPIRNIMYESSLVEDILVNLDSLNQMLKVVGIV